jgi:spore germination cell wall hydrolase CwlJ-like protein
MRNNKAILDEAARSVRRTFIGSAAGTLTMLAVVGAAGAYGMPEKLTAQALSAAMAKLSVKFPHEAEAPAAERPVVVAQNTLPRSSMPVSPVSDAAPDDPVVQTAAPAAPVVTPPPSLVAPPETIVAAAPPIADAAATAKPSSAAETVTVSVPVVEAAPVSNPFVPAEPAPAPTVTASLMPRALPEIAEERPLLSAPMVFEAPKPADAQVLTEMPKTEVVVSAPEPANTAPAPKQAETPAPVSAPVQQASLAAEPNLVEVPKIVSIVLPQPKPPLTPAQRLELQGKDYDKAEKCLAQAIYFEARAEPTRGQQAVAQVVLNRVFSPYYPKDVCSVVYQNAHRHLSCQFTFACDGKPESVNERGAWTRANRIAQQTLNAKVWLPEVNKATHYHASYVRPNWIRDMKVMVRYGVHTFYRPRNWGDGSDEAHWGTPANAAKPATAATKPEAAPAAKKVALRRT